MKDCYKDHVKTFLTWLGDNEITWKKMKAFKVYLNDCFQNRTNVVKWNAAKDYASDYLPGTDAEQKGHWAEIQALIPYPDAQTKRTNHLTDEEHNKLYLEAKSERQKFFIKYIRMFDKNISEFCNMRLSDPVVTDDTRALAIKIFGSKKYLCETSNGRKYCPSYISNQIAYLGRRILEKRISAISLRRLPEWRRYNK